MNWQLSSLIAWCLVAGVRTSAWNPTDYQAGVYGVNPNQTYHSVNFASPLFQVNTWNKQHVDSSSHIFISYNLSGQACAPMIHSADDLSLVWADPSYDLASDVRVQRFHGEDFLTFWGGEYKLVGHGSGSCFMLDQSYRVRYNISTSSLPVGSDLHECHVTDHGTMLITAYVPIPYDLERFGGSANDTLLNSVFQEVDIVTGEVLFTWDATDHAPLDDTYSTYQRGKDGWDWFHTNSIQKTAEGNYLISSRACHSLFFLDGTTGKPIWIMGGKRNQFTDASQGRALNFALQHHARFQNENLTLLSLFDNHVEGSKTGCTHNCSRGLHLEIDYAARSVSLISEDLNPAGLETAAMGSAHVLDNGNTLVNWGTNPSITEHSPDGVVQWDIQFGVLGGPGSGSYRAFKQNWVGYPTTSPSIAIKKDSAFPGETVYVSWNGATEVSSWLLRASNSKERLALKPQVRVTVQRSGFETAIPVRYLPRFVSVAAIDREGRLLGTSPVWDRTETITSMSELILQEPL